jgi:hypothetical protein
MRSSALTLIPSSHQMDDTALMAAEREKAKKHKTFNEIEKRKVRPPPLPPPPSPLPPCSQTTLQRDLGQCSRAKSACLAPEFITVFLY